MVFLFISIGMRVIILNIPWICHMLVRINVLEGNSFQHKTTKSVRALRNVVFQLYILFVKVACDDLFIYIYFLIQEQVMLIR